MWFSLADLVLLPEEIRESIYFIGGSQLKLNMQVLMRNIPALSSFFPIKGEKLRKVVGIPDKEGKTRVIAILDYFSQTALKPVHMFLFQVLKRIPQDVTFDQASYQKIVASWGQCDEYHSIDLSAATDRFPIRLIGDLLGVRFGYE